MEFKRGMKGKIIEASYIFKQFIKYESNHEHYHYNYANTLSRLGQYKEAIKHYQECLKINPNHATA